MLEALRGLGYSPASALPDVIDNSIAACASMVDLQFSWRGVESYIAILDNGTGMDESALDRAMGLGEMHPLGQRASHDLGRLSLDLKTASFAQCRRLTVASKKAGMMSCLYWDLDVLSASQDDGWHLLEEPSEGSEVLIAPVERLESGTLVL